MTKRSKDEVSKGSCLVSVYSSGAIGRLVRDDVIGMIE
jgi:hypothetical protein